MRVRLTIRNPQHLPEAILSERSVDNLHEAVGRITLDVLREHGERGELTLADDYCVTVDVYDPDEDRWVPEWEGRPLTVPEVATVP